MSVSQVKKRFGEFESFLKKDKEGLRRLKLLKDDVNILRTDLASAIEAKAAAEEIKDAARARADSAEAERDALKLEAHSLKQQVASLMMDLASATKPDEDPEAEPDVAPGRFSQGMKSTLKSLMRGNELPRCPKPCDDYRRDGGHLCHTFYRNEISKGWSRRSLYLIGALVSIMVDVEGEVKIRSWANTEEDKDGRVKDETLIKHLIGWIRPNLDLRDHGRSGTGIYTDNVR